MAGIAVAQVDAPHMVVGHADHEVQLQVGLGQFRPAAHEGAGFGEIRCHHAAPVAPVSQVLGHQAPRAAQRHAEQVGRRHALVQDDVEVILQVAAHAGQVMHHIDTVLAQVGRRPDARRHQQLRRAERPCRHDHFAARAQHEFLAVAPGQHPHRTAFLEKDAQHLRAGHHMQMAAPAVAIAVPGVAAVQVRAGGVPALAVVLGDLIPAHAFLFAAVEIVIAQDAGMLRGIDKVLAERIGRAQVAHMQRPGAAVQRVVVMARHALVAFGAAEVWQHIVPRPAIAAGGSPAVVVGGPAAHIDHGVDR